MFASRDEEHREKTNYLEEGALSKSRGSSPSTVCFALPPRTIIRIVPFELPLYTSSGDQTTRYFNQEEGEELCRCRVDLGMHPNFLQEVEASLFGILYIDFVLGFEMDSAGVEMWKRRMSSSQRSCPSSGMEPLSTVYCHYTKPRVHSSTKNPIPEALLLLRVNMSASMPTVKCSFSALAPVLADQYAGSRYWMVNMINLFAQSTFTSFTPPTRDAGRDILSLGRLRQMRGQEGESCKMKE
ncbi:hypothetical protein BS47DRAFT_1384020 [Hydnum rufescens UP504]|uniref:Uncharacterized protein n=1 Tax=Hydnum rufescens UP504 TaxID=1448309 RepID=A0A9P6DPS3_9AGAM|nr:hypothetical protein BS47DRAFT_1384020 [Hydnum rufescens UP504]